MEDVKEEKEFAVTFSYLEVKRLTTWCTSWYTFLSVLFLLFRFYMSLYSFFINDLQEYVNSFEGTNYILHKSLVTDKLKAGFSDQFRIIFLFSI